MNIGPAELATMRAINAALHQLGIPIKAPKIKTQALFLRGPEVDEVQCELEWGPDGCDSITIELCQSVLDSKGEPQLATAYLCIDPTSHEWDLSLPSERSKSARLLREALGRHTVQSGRGFESAQPLLGTFVKLLGPISV